MKFLSTLLVFGGYTLVYAAIANHGAYAQKPWLGVFRDAYGVDNKSAGAAAPSASTTSTLTPVITRTAVPNGPMNLATGATV